MTDFLKDLNKQQLEAVTAPLGPVLVLAGAGSGKTRALTYRIAYLIKTKQFFPNQILAVTFTNKAAREMSERIEKIINVPSDIRPSLGTFHSIFARVLRKEIYKLKPYTPSFSIFDEDDSLRALKQIIKSGNYDREISPTFARSLISSVKNGKFRMVDLQEEGFVHIFESYQRLLQEANALDFDDLLVLPVRLFQEHASVLQKYQDNWPYILIDEYQDTNNLQYQLIKLLVGDNRNLFAVGDDAQSIYGFRGANYQNILNFEKDFPDAKVYTLDQNYRSSEIILSAANEIIKLSSHQKPKNLWTDNSGGQKITAYTALDEVAESMFVASEILKLSGSGDSSEPSYVTDDFEEAFSDTEFFDNLIRLNAKKLPKRQVGRSKFSKVTHSWDKLKEIAVLYRTNAQSRVLEEVFLQFGLPYHLVGAVRFYERKEIKDVLAYLRVILNAGDFISLSRIINVPPRGIGEKSLQTISSGEFSALTNKAKTGWDNLQGQLLMIKSTPSERPLAEVLELILKKFSLEEYYRDGTREGEDRWGNVQELMTVAKRFNHLPWEEGLAEFLAEVSLYSETDEVGAKQGVTLMTLHQAKGLEFDTVFLVGLEEGLLPHMRSLEAGEDLSEEIRLAYVGVTRARKNLYLTNAHVRRIYGSTLSLKPSRILKAIPKELLEKKESTYEW